MLISFFWYIRQTSLPFEGFFFVIEVLSVIIKVLLRHCTVIFFPSILRNEIIADSSTMIIIIAVAWIKALLPQKIEIRSADSDLEWIRLEGEMQLWLLTFCSLEKDDDDMMMKMWKNSERKYSSKICGRTLLIFVSWAEYRIWTKKEGICWFEMDAA